MKQTISNLSDKVIELLSERATDSNINNNTHIGIPNVFFELSTTEESSIHPLIEEVSDIDSDDDFITLTHLSVSDNDSTVYQPPTPAESHGTTPSASNTIVPPTVPDISNLSLEINEVVDVRPIDSISTVSPLLHSTPSTLTAPHIREHDRIGRENIRDVTIITDRNEAQPSSPSQTCNTSSPTPDSRLSVNIVHTVLPPDNKVTYHDVYIGNARSSTTKDDIRKQLMSMGVHKIGNIIPLRSKIMSTTAFRVFIADQHIDTNVYNKECWHRNINVEPYRVRRKIHHPNIRNRESEQKAHRQHSSNESTHHAPNRSVRSRNPRVPRTPRRVSRQRAPRFDRTPNVRANSRNANIHHLPHPPEMPVGRQDIMYTMEQQHCRQQPTMSTVHHTNGHHYGQHHASSNVVDQNVTPTMHNYAPTMGHNVSSAHNTRYAPHHGDIYMAAPQHLYHGYSDVSSHDQPPPMERHTVNREHRPHYQHSGTPYQLHMKLHHQTDLLAVI